jgi:P27 family predicted phage terminase small subunit
LLEGNPGKRPVPPPGPIDEGRPPPAPADLTTEQRAIWRRTVAEIKIILAPGDRELLYAFCVAVDHHHRAAKIVADSGMLVRGGRGSAPVKNPAESIVRANAKLIATLGAELALSPSARERLIRGTGGGTEPSRAARLLS